MLKILPPADIRMPSGLSFEGTGLKSVIKWQTRTDWIASDRKITAFATEPVEEKEEPEYLVQQPKIVGKKLYERDYQLDMHRWIRRNLEPSYLMVEGFGIHAQVGTEEEIRTIGVVQPLIRGFAEKYGDFFTNDVTADLTELNIKDWVREWEFINDWKLYLEDEEFKRADLEQVIRRKLNRYTGAEVVERKSGKGNHDIALRPQSWAGWCWALIARDFYDDISYKPCINYDNCGREVPSHTLTGNPTNRCSEKCRKAAYRKRSANLPTTGEDNE